MSKEVEAPSYRTKSEIELEKYRIRFGFLKVIFGTLLVGLASVLVPGAIEYWKVTFEDQRLKTQFDVENKRRLLEIKLSQINQQQAYVKDFLDTALNQDVELRIRFADYFSNVSADPFRENWIGYRDSLIAVRNETRREIHSKENDLLRGLSIEEPSIDQQIVIARLSRELEWRYREIGYIARNRSIVRSDGEVADSEQVVYAPIDKADIRRIVLHWTFGRHTANASDLKHYHEVIESDGERIRGNFPPSSNVPPLKGGAYAAHTRGINSHSVGLAVAAMAGAREVPFTAGMFPITVKQVEALCDAVVEYSLRYGIPITRETVLTHAEVQPTLGNPQSGKWDITWLPGMTATGDPIEVGDRFRRMVSVALDAPQLSTGGPASCQFEPEATAASSEE